jgi:hypothetical protein
MKTSTCTKARFGLIATIAPAIQLFFLLAILAVSSSLKAQTSYGSIVGTVTDPSGAVIPDAKVTATDLGTSEVVSVNTDKEGKFSFVNLLPSTYKVDVTKSGFKHFIEDRVTVEVGNTSRVDSALQVGAATETVEVSTEAPLLKTDSSTLSMEVSPAQIEAMPLNGRNVLNLIALTPGVVPTGGSMGNPALNQVTRSAGGQGFGNYEIGGSIQGQSAQLIDGVSNNLLGNNAVALVPTQDAIQEFSVASSNPSADFGRSAGGVVNMTTRGGGNRFHGSLYEYFRNRDLNANDYFSNENNHVNSLVNPRVQYNQNQYGAAVSGPIVKDKAFFSFTWEGYALLAQNTSAQNNPTEAVQNGVFSNTLSPDPLGICNIQPYTGQTVNGQTFPSGGTYIANLYQAGLKPGTTCGDPLNEVLKNEVPGPSVAQIPGANFVVATPLGNNQNQYNGRVDYTLGPKDRLFARYTYAASLDIPHTEYNDIGQPGTSLTGFNGWPTSDGMSGAYNHQAVIGDTHTFNSSTVLDFRLDYLRQYAPNLAQDRNTPYGQFYGNSFGSTAIPNIIAQIPVHIMPAFQVSGGSTNINLSNFTNSGYTWNNSYGTSASLVKILGAHNFKVGLEARLMDLSSLNETHAGSYTYGSNGFGVNDGWGNFLLGYASSVSFSTSAKTAAYSYYQAYYASDTWQASRSLTLTLGLRYELPGAYAERNNKALVLLLNHTGADPTTGVPGPTDALVNSDLYGGKYVIAPKYNLFAPRLGFSYRASSNTVVRAGWGISYLPSDITGGNPNGGTLNSANTAPSINTSTGNVPVPLNGVGGYLDQLNQGDYATGGSASQPLNLSLGRGAAAGKFATGAQSTYFMGQTASLSRYLGKGLSGTLPFQPYPWVQQWNFALSHQFSGNTLVEVSWNGMHGTNMPGTGNRQIDQLPSSAYTTTGLAVSSNPALNGLPLSNGLAVGACPAAPLLGQGSTTPFGQSKFTVGQCLRKYPYYNGVSEGSPYFAIQNYRSFQTKVERRMGAAGTLIANYTWAQSKGNTDTQAGFLEFKSSIQGGQSANGYQDYNNPLSDYSLISFDVTNRMIVAYNLSLPFGKGKKFGNNFSAPLDAIVSGWALNGITTFQSGYPIDMSVSGSTYQLGSYGAGGVRPNVVPGCQKQIKETGLERVQAGLWFNTACFVDPATSAVGANGNSYSFGNEPRVDPSLRGDGEKNIDFSFQKSMPIHESSSLTFRTEMFNVLNRVQFAPPGSQIGGSPSFGVVTYQVNKPRQIQLSLRLNY